MERIPREMADDYDRTRENKEEEEEDDETNITWWFDITMTTFVCIT